MSEQKTQLKNNIDFLYKRNENTPRTALCLNFSINEPEKSAGIYSVMARLFMQGTKTRSAEQLAEELDKYAIEFCAELKQDYLRFRFLCLNEDFSKALELMTDIIQNTTFEDFDREIAKMEGEIICELDSPRCKAMENYYKTLFEGHHYGNTYTKMLENIKNIKKDDVVEAYKNIVNNSRKTLTFVGDLDLDDVLPQLNNTIGNVENPDGAIEKLPIPIFNEKKEVEIIKPDLNQAHIIQGWLVPTFESEDYPALILLNIMLGACGLSSRLFLELRDKKGLAYVVRSSYETFALAANFSIYIATEPKNIEVSLEGFKEEINKLKTDLVSEEELENAKNNILGKWAFTQETNSQQACLKNHYAVMGFGFDFNAQTKERIKHVTPEQVKACANKYFNDNYVVSIIKP